MPFTFCHPAIVLPFGKVSGRYISMTGLVFGSIAPDFEYFIRMKMESKFSHSISGAFYFDLPIALLLSFLFYLIIRDSLYDNLPVFIRKRVITYQEFNWMEYFKKSWIVVVVSILLGIFSHLIWDSFTHKTGFIVKYLPVLNNHIMIFNQSIAIFKILQHLSSILGAIVILYFIYRLPSQKVLTVNTSLNYWLIVIVTILIVLSIRILFGINGNIFGQLVTILISSSMIGILLASIFMKGKKNAAKLCG